jgi:hypothetical protein
MGVGNAGRPCMVIVEHKKVKDLQRIRSFRDLEEFSGFFVEILPYDLVFSTMIDSIGAPYSVWWSEEGKDVTIVVYGTEEEAQKAAEKMRI